MMRLANHSCLFFAVIALFFAATDRAVFADDETQDELTKARTELATEADNIEQKLKACEEKNWSTMGLISCNNEAYAAYDKLMNKVYIKVLKISDVSTRKSVQNAQRKWLLFRDAEFSAQGDYPRQGTIRGVMLGREAIDFVKRRISELTFYLQDTSG